MVNLYKRHAYLAGCIGCFVSLALLAMISIGFVRLWFHAGKPPQRQFDSQAWKTSASRLHWNARSEMIEDLTDRYRFVGMRRDDVEEILGQPDSDLPGWELAYWVGPDRSFAFDQEWLVFRIDENNIVAKWQLIEQ